MKKVRCAPRTLIVAAGLFCVAQAAWGQAELSAQGGGGRSTDVVGQAQSDEELQAMLRKRNVYVKLFNDTMRISESWSRYGSWVNMRTGPTGRERIVYGLYSVSPEIVKRAVEAANMQMPRPPAMAALDAAARRMIDRVDPVVALLNKAEGYYERKDYRDDRMAEGKKLHAEMARVVPDFLARRAAFERELDGLQASLQTQELGLIERREGRKYRWHAKRVLIAAAPLPGFINSTDVRTRLNEADAAIAAYARAVREFDEYMQQPEAQKPIMAGIGSSTARSFLGNMRDWREAMAKRRRTIGLSSPTFLISEYNRLIDHLGNSR